ncbi:MAG: inosine/xanthosine triphosphatase [Calditrichota bacterium]|jgi:inosine/xanthosine triphosphatase
MNKVVVASLNPVKIKAVRNAFRKMFPAEIFEIDSCSVSSGVADQPMSDQETLQGAFNRCQQASRQVPNADYYVGIEGGIADSAEGMAAFAWIVILSHGRIGRGRTGTFFLPDRVTNLVRKGKELGEANDIVFDKHNSKQVNGAIGLLTGDIIDRTRLYQHGVLMALVPFRNPDFYAESS